MEEKIFKILLSYSAESKDLEQTHKELCNLFNVSDMFTAEQMKEAWFDGEHSDSSGDQFDVNNYR